MSEKGKSRERETVDSILEALIVGKVRFNRDGWQGTRLSIGFVSPVEFLNGFRKSLADYGRADESEKEQLSKTVYGEIISARIGGLLIGETTSPGEIERLREENTKLRNDMKKLLAATTGQDSAEEAVPYQ